MCFHVLFFVRLLLSEKGLDSSFHSPHISPYRGAHIIFVTFDVTDEESFHDCVPWLNDVARFADENVVTVGVGLNIDLVEARVVSKETAQSFFSSRNIPYFEASAKTGEGVNDVFINAVGIWLARQPSKNSNGEEEKPDKKKDCSIQ